MIERIVSEINWKTIKIISFGKNYFVEIVTQLPPIVINKAI